MKNDAYIFDALRTPRGKKKDGSLHEMTPTDILAKLLKSLQDKHDLDTSQVDDVIMGCATPVGDQGANIAKASVQYAGWDDDVPGVQVNRFCASGLETVNMAAMKVRSGWEDLIVAGGIECMSRVPMGSDGGSMAFEPKVNLRTQFVPQGIGADLIATLGGHSREDVDALALESQRRASHASKQGYFKSIVPVTDQNGLDVLANDEHIRPNTTMDDLSALKPAFEMIGNLGYDAVALGKYTEIEAINHVHTAGNSSGIVDGAAAVLIGSEAKGKDLRLTPRAKIISAATVSTDPTIMLTGPGPASKKALKKAGMQIEDIDLIEANEAFAAVILRFIEDMRLENNEKVNVNGGSIAMGHPLGATGAMLLGTVMDELERRDLNTALITLCVAGGMGIGTIIERV
ncbi:MAG: acetyl-CoA C-acetyltransferase [Candidatus Neomarinimicrobiota bacterium]|nr:acetyl-CoA C-acetyltransferase [Candidatus Neomarinimicrobiota bacterium]